MEIFARRRNNGYHVVLSRSSGALADRPPTIVDIMPGRPRGVLNDAAGTNAGLFYCSPCIFWEEGYFCIMQEKASYSEEAIDMSDILVIILLIINVIAAVVSCVYFL